MLAERFRRIKLPKGDRLRKVPFVCTVTPQMALRIEILQYVGVIGFLSGVAATANTLTFSGPPAYVRSSRYQLTKSSSTANGFTGTAEGGFSCFQNNGGSPTGQHLVLLNRDYPHPIL
ncbi:hypothetical protein GGX14DRAFT_391951 [Mycena pura]|uniref:Uncharacterized protein n=1 Tax=Mycena pura TaxID=153505 RepID=A0AAD6YJJ2_9AGAR|nr:hypothetical protein GGX14DRAFT_391951 [Mycena pura]